MNFKLRLLATTIRRACVLAMPFLVTCQAIAAEPTTRTQLPPVMEPGTRPSTEQINGLIQRLGSRSPEERRTAAAALQRMGMHAASARTALFMAIGDAAPAVQVAAADAWAATWGRGRQAVDGLLPALKDDREVLRSAAINQLALIGDSDAPRIIPALIPLLDDADETVRAKAASAIGTLAEHAPQEAANAVPPLLKVLTDQKDKLAWEKRFDAARTLLRIGPAARSAAPQLMQAIRTPDAIPHLRDRLIPLLPRIVEKPKELLPLLTELKSDKDPSVAAEAGKLMEQIDSASPATSTAPARK